jgi:hypothetical protein
VKPICGNHVTTAVMLLYSFDTLTRQKRLQVEVDAAVLVGVRRLGNDWRF